MYRRNISHLIYKIAFVVAAVILYGSWFKPTYMQQPPAVNRSQAGVHLDESKQPPERGPAPDGAEPALKQTRLIDPSVVPDTKDHAQLAAIRDELEKGDLQSARLKLDDLPPP